MGFENRCITSYLEACLRDAHPRAPWRANEGETGLTGIRSGETPYLRGNEETRIDSQIERGPTTKGVRPNPAWRTKG